MVHFYALSPSFVVMIAYQEFTLENGLRVLVHEDADIPTAVVNILYDVGSRDEEADKTGLAHFFEHLMFGGSVHVPSYDLAAHRAGAHVNAFTCPDFTNYYLTLPAENIETAFWLESDRMMQLSFCPQVLERERKVVIEEFKQRYLNQPYGDVWLKLRPLAYRKHPYRWATIGKEIAHIESFSTSEVRNFYNKYYLPNNAVMVVGGNVRFEAVKQMVKKWFDEIPPGKVPPRILPEEPRQTACRRQNASGNVPQNAIYLSYHMCRKTDAAYHATDLLNDLLGRGKSSRLYDALVKKRPLFSAINAYLSDSFDEGLFTISGHLNPNTTHEQAEFAVLEVLESLKNQPIQAENLKKVKAQAETTALVSKMDILNRCIYLAQGCVLGDPDLVNKETLKIRQVTPTQVKKVAKEILTEDNLSVLYYHKT